MEIVFDPKTALRYASISDKTDRLVLSPLAMIFIAVLRFWRLSPDLALDLARHLWREVGPCYSRLKGRILAVGLLWIFLLGVAALLRPAGHAKMLCLTANSTFLEALRAAIAGLPSDLCGPQTIEVLHGINSPTFDPYFLSYRQALGAGRLSGLGEDRSQCWRPPSPYHQNGQAALSSKEYPPTPGFYAR